MTFDLAHMHRKFKDESIAIVDAIEKATGKNFEVSFYSTKDSVIV